jgi:transposase-like protein
MLPRRCRLVPAFSSSAFAGFRFPSEIIVLAVRWYLRYGLSYRDVEELLAERGIEVDHVHRLSVGTTIHATPRRRRSPVPPCGR